MMGLSPQEIPKDPKGCHQVPVLLLQGIPNLPGKLLSSVETDAENKVMQYEQGAEEQQKPLPAQII